MKGYLANWTVGRNELSKLLMSDSLTQKRVIYELCVAGVRQEVTVDRIKELWGLCSSRSSALEQALSDALWVLELESVASSHDEEKRKKLVAFVKSVFQSGCVSQRVLETVLDQKLMEEAGIVKSAQQFFKQMVIVNTRMTLTQPTFFQLYEASEGFSKLVVEMSFNQSFSEERYRSIVGFFSLEASRCLDLCLAVLERGMGVRQVLLRIIATGPVDVVYHLLHRRLKRAHALESSSLLLHAVADLMAQGIVNLSNIYPMLQPMDEDGAKWFEVQKTRIASAANSVKGGQEGFTDALEGAFDADSLKQIVQNQKFTLCKYLLQVGDWSNGFFLFKRLLSEGISLSTEVVKELCLCVENAIEPLFGSIYFSDDQHPLEKRSIPESLVVHSHEDVLSKVLPVLRSLGSVMGLSPSLFSKMCKLLADCLIKSSEQDKSNTFAAVEAFCGHVLLPALSFLRGHTLCASCATQAFDLLKIFPLDARCRIYTVWRQDGFTHPLASFTKSAAFVEIKFILRRLNADAVSISNYGRKIGALSHAFPILVFESVISQIQNYTNMISPVVDFLKYQSVLAKDVIIFVLLESIASKQKSAKKADGTNLAEWLSSLATFVGLFFNKYKDLSCAPVLQLVKFKLLDDSPSELTLLESLISKMACIDANGIGMSEKQVAAQAGLDALKVASRPIPIPHGTSRSASRLREALEESGLLAEFPRLIILKGLRKILFSGSELDLSLKMVADSYDKTHDLLLQYIGFLNKYVDVESLSKLLPSLTDLVVRDGFTLPEALTLLRAVLSNRYGDVKAVCFGDDVVEGSSLVEEVVQLCPQLSSFSSLYTCFWTLRLSDLVFPKASYEEVMKSLQRKLGEIEGTVGEYEAMDPKHRAKEADSVKQQLSKVEHEWPAQKEQVERTREYLTLQTRIWLPELENSGKKAFVADFLQYCVFPRCKMSSEDAMFAAEFAIMLHESRTPGFSTYQFIDFVVKFSGLFVGAMSENEAFYFGKFFSSILARITKWKSSEEDFSRHVGDTPGFMLANTAVTYSGFQQMAFLWHKKITANVCRCLESKEYLVIRNALLMITRMSDEFPQVDTFAADVSRRVKDLMEKTEMSDIKLLATRYESILSQRTAACVSKAVFTGDQDKEEVQEEQPQKKKQEKEKPQEKEKTKTSETPKQETKPAKSGGLAEGDANLLELKKRAEGSLRTHRQQGEEAARKRARSTEKDRKDDRQEQPQRKDDRRDTHSFRRDRDDSRRDDSRREDTRREDNRRDDNKRDDNKRDDNKRDDNKRDDNKRDDNRRDDNRRDDNRRDDNRRDRDDNRRDDTKRDDRRDTGGQKREREKSNDRDDRRDDNKRDDKRRFVRSNDRNDRGDRNTNTNTSSNNNNSNNNDRDRRGSPRRGRRF